LSAPRAEFAWVLVCGGFHYTGGMDRANAALARYLVDRGARVHLVAHDVDSSFFELPRVDVSIVPRPGGSYLAGELLLERTARTVTERLRRGGQRVRVVANGGNTARADVNWVHSVHHAWPCRDAGAPVLFRARNRAFKAWSRLRERRALGSAPLVIANSRKTARDVVALGVAADRVRTVYLGSNVTWTPPNEVEREEARRKWCSDPRRALVVFVGALGHDTNKGIDIVLDAWKRTAAAKIDAELVVAGAGATARWQKHAQDVRADVRFVGFTSGVGHLLNAADLLVSPVGYEAYGLAAHEAVCREVPVIITKTAGLVERLSTAVGDMLLPEQPNADALADALHRWWPDRAAWRDRIRADARQLRAYSDEAMAEQIVEAALAEAA
jgi:glycosyltransferase involved in cell wall biosynthesis